MYKKCRRQDRDHAEDMLKPYIVTEVLQHKSSIYPEPAELSHYTLNYGTQVKCVHSQMQDFYAGDLRDNIGLVVVCLLRGSTNAGCIT